ncbi:MAG TPA: PLP-dependent aminotransferase family protein [Thermoanaerobaculia bacterium]|nr:PLP-dependent aminotransferase family protein [Thermoanaerobaculia bacterium]
MQSPAPDPLFSADSINFRPNAIRAFAHLMNDPRVISLAGGAPSPDTFPADRLAEIAARVIREKRNVALQYGATPGIARLREAIAAIAGERKIRCAAENVLVTTGSQQALHLLATVLLDPGDVVLVELPSYIGALSAFYGRRAVMAGVRQDEEGIVPEDLAAVIARVRSGGGRIKFLYTIPNFQNPSGRLLAQERRDRVLEIARREGVLVVEDDPYGELVFDAAAETTPIASRDADLANTIYLGSFSKILAPGLRCGFIVGPAAVLQKVQLAKEAADLCSGMLDQSIVDEFVAAGELPAQIERVRDFYRARSGVLLGALGEHFGSRAQWTPTRGGLFTFLTVPERVDAKALVPAAIEAGVAYVPGEAFFVDGSGRNTMRLTFAKEPDARMREGVRRLAGVVLGR